MRKTIHLSSQRQMIIQDKLVKEQNDAKNAVEEYVYDLRDKLGGVYEKYITEDVSADLLTWLTSKEYQTNRLSDLFCVLLK